MFYGKWGLESIQHRINPGHLSGAEALNRENTRMNVSCLEQDICRPGGGALLGILVGGVPPGSPNPDPISDQPEMSFSTPVFRPGRDHKTQHVYKDRNCIITSQIRTPTKRFLKIHFEFAY